MCLNHIYVKYKDPKHVTHLNYIKYFNKTCGQPTDIKNKNTIKIFCSLSSFCSDPGVYFVLAVNISTFYYNINVCIFARKIDNIK